MSDVVKLLSQLKRLDIKLELLDGKLKVNAPRGALTEEIKVELKENREALIAFISQIEKQDLQQTAIEAAPASAKDEGIPATDSQARFWFLNKFSPGDPSFNIPAVIEIRGEIDRELFRKSLDLLILRHESLRTSFKEVEGKPVLDIRQELDWHLVESIQTLESEAQLKKFIEKKSADLLGSGFDLETAPLMKLELVQIEKNYRSEDNRPHFLLLACIHHIICDGWSIDIILRDLSAIYISLLKQGKNLLPPLEINFSDYAYWLNSDEQKAREQESIKFWKENLDGAKGLLDFPYDRPRPLRPMSEGDSVAFELEKTVSADVDSLCQHFGITPFMFFMAVYQLCISLYSKENDICVGVPIAGRTRQEIENIVGLFLNALVVRNRPSSAKTVESFLTDVKQNTLSAFDHQDIAVDTLIEHLVVDREHEEVPGVQFAFIFQNAHDQNNFSHLDGFESDGLSLKPVDLGTQTSKHDLCLTMARRGEVFKGSLEYRSSLLDSQSVETFVQHYLGLVKQFVGFHKNNQLNSCLSALQLFNTEELAKSLGVEQPVEAIRSLTASQEGFYLNDLIRGDNQSTLIGYSILIKGDFDTDRWHQCLQQLCDQRAVLRTRIYPGTDKLHEAAYQVVLKSQEVDFEVIDGKGLSVDQAQQQARDIIYTPFTLQKSALIRYRVIVLDDKQFIVITSMHHTLLDAISGFQHWVEAQKLYQNETIEDDNYLEYLDFAEHTIDSPEVLEFWRPRLKNVDAPDYSVHGSKSAFMFHEHGERKLRRLMIEGEQWQQVKQFCRKNKITPAILYKIVFGYMVECYSQTNNSFYINEIVTGRPTKFSRTFGNCFLIQPFIFNEGQFNQDAQINHAFELARQQQKQIRGLAYISQQEFEKLRSRGRVSFFYNYLTFVPPEDFLGNPVDFRDWGNEIDEAVEFNPRLGPDGLELNLFYREGLFREKNFLENLQFIVAQISQGADTFGELKFVQQVEQGSFLSADANDLQKSLEQKALTVVDLFLGHCGKRPDATALVSASGSYSYGKLCARSAQVANLLIREQVKAGDRVVVEQQKSLDFMASVLGVLRVGAQYVPLDSSLPEDRKNYIHENSGATFIINQEKVSLLDDFPESFEDKPISLSSPAYTIYTSGSTGAPKGVQVSHGPLVRTYYAWQEEFFLSEDDRHLQMASVGFDVFTGDWVRALCSGASTYLVDKETLMDADKLLDVIVEQKISIGEFVPAVLRNVLASCEQKEQRLDMRMLIVGSDAWYESDQHLLERFVDKQCLLVNSYGVTEAVIDSSYSLAKVGESIDESSEEQASVSIGLPFANNRLYVLDEFQRLLPCEVAGELCIAGDDLADGYVNDELQTQAVFIKDSVTENVDQRMYRTGDRAKLCQNGDLILLGRIGQQIKIRGFRIELGEIENQISDLPETDECVVLAYEDQTSKQKSLVAYIVFRDGTQLSTSEVRTAIARHLPDYMLPSLCIALDEIPLNANGKLDRNALPEPDFSKASLHEYVAPRNNIEEGLLAIWQSVLGMEKIGVNDSFFELGGHSLLATQLVARVKENFGREVPIKLVFEHPSIAGQAEQLQTALAKDAKLSAPALVPVERQALMPVSYAQQRFWFLDQLVPGFFAYNMPFGLRIRGTLDHDAFAMTMTEVLRRHESLRCNFVAEGDCVRAKVNDYESFPLELVDLSQLNEEEKQTATRSLVEKNAHKPFDLQKDLLIRCTLVQVSEDEYMILGCIHHIISDGWSVRILFREIAVLYNAFSQGRPSPLPALKIHYLDFAAWEQNWLTGEVLDRYTDFWIKELEGAPEILKLPTDKPRPHAQTFNGKQIGIRKPLAFKQKLERFSTQQNVSLFMSLMAAMAILMSRYTKEKDILIGTPVAGREQLASENIMGLFLNAVIIRSRLEGNPSIERFLSSVRDRCLSAFAYQDMPAEILYERVANHRNPQYPAGAQVGLVLQNTATQQTSIDASQLGDSLKGLSAELLGTEQVISNYDFGLTIIEQQDGIDFIAEFNTDLFFDSTIEKMLSQYLYVLEQMMAEPQASLDSLVLVPQHQLLNELELDDSVYQDVLPLTAMQESMFLANRLNPYSREYGVGFSVRIRQELDVDLWNSSLQGLIDSQIVARIIFKESEKPWLDDAYQLVLKNRQAKVEFIDWSDQQKTEEEIEAHASRFINAPYNILKDDLMRVMLIKVSEDYFVGVFGAHHILMDGIAVVAFGVMGAMNYELVKKGGQAIIHEDKYKEYLLQNRQEMDSWEVQEFWKEELQNPDKEIEALEYPVNSEVLLDPQNLPEKQKKSLKLEPGHWEAVKLYCKQNRITPALYFKALYTIILNKYCRTENDFYISEILAGRPAGHMNALGCYFQQIPIVLEKENFGRDSLITDIFKALRQQQKRSKNKQLISVPLQLSMLPQAPVSFMYNFEHYIPDFYFMGQPVEIQEYSNQVNGIVQLLVKTLVDSVQLNLQSQHGFFEDFDLLERMQALSLSIISGTSTLGEIDLLNEQEQKRLLSETTGEITEKPQQCVHELFENAVEQYSDNIAVRDSRGSLTYKELNEQANQLARYLIEKGVGKGDCVGVCLPLCKEVPLAIMAILKTGAAYLPMDSRYPRERLEYFIKDSRPKMILGLPNIIEGVFPESRYSELFYSLSDGAHLEYAIDNPDLDISNKNLVYVLYTSGSTGKPNCTATWHYCEVNLIDWYRDRFEMTSDDNVLVISAMGFDLTQKNFIAPLCSGATIVFYDSELFDANQIKDLLKKENISWLNCAPSAFYPLVSSEEDFQYASSLRWVFLGGEAIIMDRLAYWYKDPASQNTLLVNTYGPSECTDISAFHVIEKGEAFQTIPIGKANNNVSLYVMDQHRTLLPEGLVGELYVGGMGVGAEYVNNEQLSKEKFFENPYAEGRIYKTGDLVRFTRDFNLEYIGRSDFQIKVRGIRIEPGEIESRINQHPDVQESLVMLNKQSGKEDSLVAYMVRSSDAKENEFIMENVQSELRRYFNPSVLPSAYMLLDEFPLTPNGKIDRKALPEIVTEEKMYVEPETELEKELASIWSDLLNQEKIGRYDNFFEIGGHSLLAVQLVSRINKTFRVELPLAVLFEAQTLDSLAIKLESYSSNEWKPLVSIKSTGEKQLFCIHPVGGEVLCYRELARALGNHFSVQAIQASGLISGQEIISDANVLIKSYADIIQEACSGNQVYLAGQSIGGVFAVAVAGELRKRNVNVAMLALFDSFVPNEKHLQQIAMDQLRAALGAFIQTEEQDLLEMSELAQLRQLFEQAKEAYLIPQEIEFSQVSNRYQMVKSNIEMAQSLEEVFENGMRPGAAIDIPCLHIEAEKSLSALSSAVGWEKVFSRIKFSKCRGDHESILHAENIKPLAKAVLDFSSGLNEKDE